MWQGARSSNAAHQGALEGFFSPRGQREGIFLGCKGDLGDFLLRVCTGPPCPALPGTPPTASSRPSQGSLERAGFMAHALGPDGVMRQEQVMESRTRHGWGGSGLPSGLLLVWLWQELHLQDGRRHFSSECVVLCELKAAHVTPTRRVLAGSHRDVLLMRRGVWAMSVTPCSKSICAGWLQWSSVFSPGAKWLWDLGGLLSVSAWTSLHGEDEGL